MEPGTQVAIIVTDALNPTNIWRDSGTASIWCQASGTMVFPYPVSYRVELAGTSALDSTPVQNVVLYPRVVPRHPAAGANRY
jgi:hypothetical protein